MCSRPHKGQQVITENRKSEYYVNFLNRFLARNMRYNTYITNKTEGVERLYVRLRGDKLQEWDSYSRFLDEMSVNVSLEKEGSVGVEGANVSAKNKAGFGYSDKHEKEMKMHKVYGCLTQGRRPTS